MKTLRNILVLLGAISLGVAIGYVINEHQKNYNCHEALVTMQGIQACMDTPGCFYDGDDLIDVKRSLDYHVANCKKDPA